MAATRDDRVKEEKVKGEERRKKKKECNLHRNKFYSSIEDTSCIGIYGALSPRIMRSRASHNIAVHFTCHTPIVMGRRAEVEERP